MRGHLARWIEIFQRSTGNPAFIALFILCALPSGIVTAMITPPGQSPDEYHHLGRAEGLLHGAVLGGRKQGIDPTNGQYGWMAGVKVDAGLWQASNAPVTEMDNRPVVTTADFLADRAVLPDHHRVFVNIPNTVEYFPAAYVPATLGLALGLALHAPPYACILLARLFMLAAFLTLGVLTLWITAYGEAALFTVLILPMSLFLASTVNQDGVLIGMACLACAALTRGTKGFRLLALVLMVLFLCAKPPYILLLSVFLLPLSAPGFWRRVRDVALASLPVFLWGALISVTVVIPFYRPAYLPGPLYTGDRTVPMSTTHPAINFHILLAQPSRLITLPWQTCVNLGSTVLNGAIGHLGNSQMVLPDFYYHLWYIALAVAFTGLAFTPRPQADLPPKAGLNFLFVAVLLPVIYWWLLLTFYVDWTRVGMDTIGGVQGRYLLPLMPFLLLAIPGLRCRCKLHPLVPAIPSILLGLGDVAYLPMKLVWNFYLH